MAKSIFEKTMQACLEAKKTTPKKSVSTTSKKSLTESKVNVKGKSYKKESEDEDEVEEIDDAEMEFADDIVAVVDPELDADEMTSVAQGFQQLIDDTPADEVPETDEYVDDHIYGCPICGAKFFSDDPMEDGDTCPVCGEEANGFVLVGDVDEGTPNEETSDEGDGEDEGFDFDGEETIEVDFDEEEEEVEESRKPERNTVRKEGTRTRRPIRRAVRSERTVARKSATPSVRRAESRVRRPMRTVAKNLDEKSFNVYLNKFIRENYENARSFNVVGARMNGRKLNLECKINFKSGKSKKAILTCSYNPKSTVMLARDNKTFKAESKAAPFMFKVRTVGNIIKCEGMKYNFRTTAKIRNENKKVQVSGSYLGEGRVARKPMARRASAERVAESRRTVRRPVRRTARTTESRRLARRPVSRRSVEARRATRRTVSQRTRSESLTRARAMRARRATRR